MKQYLSIILILLITITIGGCKSNLSPIPPKNNVPGETPSTQQTPAVPKTGTAVEVSPDTKVPPQPAPVKSYSWYLTLNDKHLVPQVDQASQDLLSQNNAFYVLPNNQDIYLTFDCGYELGYTSKILDILQANQVRAAFFITGQYIKTQPELIKRMKAEGHLVCNHTMNHPDCSLLSSDQLEQEIIPLEERFAALTGFEMDKYLRPPMGTYSAASLAATKNLGYTTVFWSLALRDWDPNKQPGADYSYQYVMKNIHPGAVILLHAVSKSDTEALDQILKDLQSQGYVFATF